MIRWPWERDDETRERERQERKRRERQEREREERERRASQDREGRVRDEPKPYRDSRDHLLDELVRLDYLLWLRVQQWRDTNGGGTEEFAGYYIPDETIDRLLERASNGWGTDPVTEGVLTESHFEYLAEMTDRIEERKRLARREGTELRLVTLEERFELDRPAVDVLLVGVAPEIDPKYETVYAYLHDDVTKKRPTVDLVLRTFAPSTMDRLDRRTVFGRTAPLRANRLVRLSGDDETPLPTRSIRVDERIVDFLLGIDTVDGSIADFVDVRDPDEPLESILCHRTSADGASDEDDASRRRLDRLILDEEVTAQLERLAEWDGFDALSSNREHLMAHFYGPYGSGRGVAVRTLAADWERPLLTVHARGLARERSAERVEVLLREARLRDAVLSVSNLESLGDDAAVDVPALLRALDGFDGPVFLVGEESLPTSHRLVVSDHTFVGVEFPVPSYARRRELWESVAHLPSELDAADVAGKFRLTGGQIIDAVEMARSRAYGGELTADDVYAGCRMQSRENLGSLGRIVEPGYDWSDIVLPSDTEAHLREVAAHVEHQGRVYGDWGFEEKFSLGNGVVALFTGPSGTGKTMAAEVIANSVGLDLYKIDLSSVVSKYIGETEKNLGQVFDEAENSDAILLFDEADALFGKRSEVSDAHDRYANIEVNYLLQRVEEHDGAVILTTNFKQNMDDAFLRRIHLSVDFPRPQEAARRRIWERIFPVRKTPCGDLDYEFLSQFELTGGNIKNIAVTAAFLAASGRRTDETEGLYWAERQAIRALLPDDAADDESLSFDFLDRVEMEHVVWAIRREFQKTGKLLKPDKFGAYRELVE